MAIYDELKITDMYFSDDRISNGIVVFTYKIPNNTKSGEYTIVVDNKFSLPEVKKLFRIRDYPRDNI
jgi:hypothetical protein